MRYCLSGRQPIHILEQADEIKMKYADIGRAIDYLHDYPNKTIILDIELTDTIDWKLLSDLSENNLILCIRDLELAESCKKYNLKFYWKHDIISYYELAGVIALEPEYIILGPPLCFSLEKIKAITDIKIRMCPNNAQDFYIPRDNGICGRWIRPEDVEVYDEYVDVFDFISNDMEHERALFKVYAEDKHWPGNLNLLISALNHDVPNASLPEELGEIRANCEQRCMKNNKCRFCIGAMKFSNAIRKSYYDQLKQRIAEDKALENAF